MKRQATALVFVLVLLVLAGRAPGRGDEVAKAAQANAGRAWLADLAAGRAEAVRLQRPVLVKVGAAWCPWCRELDREVARPEVQKALQRWTLVSLDADKQADDAQALGVGSIPALRALNPFGRVVAGRDGSLKAGELVAWLDRNHERAAEVPIGELRETGAPDAVAALRLVRQLDQADALVREAALRRLEPYPAAAAVSVTEAFAEGPLQRRLAALELLSAWGAPLAGVDPWRPQTVSAERLKALRDWAAAAAHAPPAERPAPTAAELAEAGREIDRMLAVEPARVPALRERLARLGKALLPAVHDRLKRAESDAARERLTALRYRIAASDALPLKWPGGLERLAATDVRTRHRAVDELAQVASPGDESLWLDLFSDPDPLVRETALRGLRAMGASGTSEALVGLLSDPEPNVRAAVLKQLAEQPSPRAVPKVADYVARETDPDLVVHAVRVLREARGARARNVLIGLLGHESWRVRAEAVEALGKQLESRTDTGNDASQEEVIKALIGRLDDPDGFVVGRALAAFQDIDVVDAVEPLIRTADRRPDLAAKVVETLSGSKVDKPVMRAKALPRLRTLARHPRADVRVQAVKALGAASEGTVGPEVRAALGDDQRPVRIAAARVVFEKLHGLRSSDATEPSSSGETPDDPWLARFQQGKGRPDWVAPALAPLARMLASPDPEECLAAALPLIALGPAPEAVAALQRAVRARPDLVGEASVALRWRQWADRLKLFHALLEAHPDADELGQIAGAMAVPGGLHAAEPLWELVRGNLSSTAGYSLMSALQAVYFGSSYYNLSNVPRSQRRRAATALLARVETGPEWQRVVALALLLGAAPDDAGRVARATFDDPKSPAELRRDAFQVLLLAGDRAAGRAEAFAGIANSDPGIQKLALKFLTADYGGITTLREWIHLNTDSPAAESLSRQATGSGVSFPRLPGQLEPGMLRPLLKSADAETAALAGYVLALLGEADGLDTLVEYWRKLERNDMSWGKRVYQAIARAGDDSMIPFVEQVYVTSYDGRPDNYSGAQQVVDLYWTIRGMDGPNARGLRKRIRGEVGMPLLRGEPAAPMPIY